MWGSLKQGLVIQQNLKFITPQTAPALGNGRTVNLLKRCKESIGQKSSQESYGDSGGAAGGQSSGGRIDW